MAHDTLTEFFREKKSKSGADIDWQSRKQAWIQAINDLYGKIAGEYLAGPVGEQLVRVSRRAKALVEEYIGAYQVDELVVQVGDEQVVFSPKGRNIVGASGRIDLIGDMGEKTIVLQPEGRWGIVATRSPTLKVVPLDERSLLAALEEVMRG